MSMTRDAVGYASTTLPTIPSGVTTAMPLSTPLVDPRSTNTTFELAPVPLPITRAATVLEGERDSNTLKARARSAVESSAFR